MADLAKSKDKSRQRTPSPVRKDSKTVTPARKSTVTDKSKRSQPSRNSQGSLPRSAKTSKT
jgi:hypothetical protein